jgi:hypothetical protein
MYPHHNVTYVMLALSFATHSNPQNSLFSSALRLPFADSKLKHRIVFRNPL